MRGECPTLRVASFSVQVDIRGISWKRTQTLGLSKNEDNKAILGISACCNAVHPFHVCLLLKIMKDLMTTTCFKCVKSKNFPAQRMTGNGIAPSALSPASHSKSHKLYLELTQLVKCARLCLPTEILLRSRVAPPTS